MSVLLLQTGGTDNLLLQIGDNLLLQDSSGGGGGTAVPVFVHHYRMQGAA